MPQIPEEAANSALTIFDKSTLPAKIAIGEQQLANGTPLAPGAPLGAAIQLLENGTLVINQEGKIDVPPKI